MSNKQQPPKEIWIDSEELTENIKLATEDGEHFYFAAVSLEKDYETDIKYISESHYNKVVERKNFLIASQKQVITDLEAEIERLKEKKDIIQYNVCTCADGPQGRTVSADFEHQICERCGGIGS